MAALELACSVSASPGSIISTTWGHDCVVYQASNTQHLQVILVQTVSPEALVCPLSEGPSRNQ